MHLTRSRLLVGTAAAVAALAVAGCSSTSPASEQSATERPSIETSADAFPVTIEHALGTTTIDARPERVVTWGWATADAAIALGVVPVAIPFQAYGGDADGVLPWIREAVDELGLPLPTVLPDSGEDVPFEDVAAAEPDVILAQYSGLTQEQYDTLSAIAPVVAYPDEPWSTPWRDVVETTGAALGRTGEAAAALAGIDEQIAEQRDAHPEFAGKTLAAVWDLAGTFYVYADEDPRVAFMLDLGFVNAPAVDSLDTDESPFFFTLSHARLADPTSDAPVVYGTTEDEVDAFIDAPYAQVMAQVRAGTVAPLVGAEFIAAVSPPTALSLPWGLDEVVAQLATATAPAGA